MDKKQNDIYNEIINNEIIDLEFKNPQYMKDYLPKYWIKFWNLFKEYFSSHFSFSEEKKFTNRVIYLEAINKLTTKSVLFILSLSEGHMKTLNSTLLCRLEFKNNLFKKYLKEHKDIYFITFYAPLIKQSTFDNVYSITDFDNTICIISTLQEIWNCSKIYGARYLSILKETFHSQRERISIEIKYKVLLDVLLGTPLFQKDVIDSKNNKMFNINLSENKKQKKNISYNLVLLKDINGYINSFIEKNQKFIEWIKNYINQISNDKYVQEIINNSKKEEQEIENILNNKELREITKEQLIYARIGQGDFRKKLINEFQKCIFTDIDDTRLLVASHIKPWRDSNNNEKLDPNNGLLLSPLYDKLFDQGLITFSDDDKLLVSSQLSNNIIKLLDLKVKQQYFLKNNKRQEYLKYHYNNIFKK